MLMWKQHWFAKHTNLWALLLWVWLAWWHSLQADDSAKLKRAIERLEESKAKYESELKSATDTVLHRFDDMLAAIDRARGIQADIRQQIKHELQQARQEFESRGAFAKIPALQGHYVQFIVSTRTAYKHLMHDYDTVITNLPAGDFRIAKLNFEVTDYRTSIDKYDTLKPGSKFVGYRSDLDWGPIVKAVNVGNVMLLKKFDNHPVNVSFELHVKTRQGNKLTGEVSQSDGRFRAAVEGSYDGVNLHIKMTRILRGSPRAFEYAGKMVGTVGLLQLCGIKANGVATTGLIVLELQ